MQNIIEQSWIKNPIPIKMHHREREIKRDPWRQPFPKTTDPSTTTIWFVMRRPYTVVNRKFHPDKDTPAGKLRPLISIQQVFLIRLKIKESIHSHGGTYGLSYQNWNSDTTSIPTIMNQRESLTLRSAAVHNSENKGVDRTWCRHVRLLKPELKFVKN